MNIWVFNHYAVAKGSSGPTRHFDLAKELVRENHQVTIFASSFDHQTRQEKHIFDATVKFIREVHEGVTFVWVKTTPYQKNDWRRVLNMLSYTWRAYRTASKMNEKPDIVIGSLMHPFAALLGYFMAKKKGCKFYFEERDLWPQTLIDLGKVSEKNPIVLILSWLELFLYKKADKIIVLFDKAVDYVEKRGIHREKVICLPNGVDLGRYEVPDPMLPADIDRVLKELEDKFIAVYTGAHGLANNLDVLLDAAGLLKNKNDKIHFLLVGDGPEKRRLMQRKEEEQLANVTFLPALPKEQIPVILKKSDVGLLPLKDSPVFKWGISPNKMFDYMASSKPVILLCNLDGTPIEKSGGGIVIKKDFSIRLAEILNEMVSGDKDQVEEMGKKARTYVEQYHSWDVLAKRFIESLEK